MLTDIGIDVWQFSWFCAYSNTLDGLLKMAFQNIFLKHGWKYYLWGVGWVFFSWCSYQITNQSSGILFPPSSENSKGTLCRELFLISRNREALSFFFFFFNKDRSPTFVSTKALQNSTRNNSLKQWKQKTDLSIRNDTESLVFNYWTSGDLWLNWNVKCYFP